MVVHFNFTIILIHRGSNSPNTGFIRKVGTGIGASLDTNARQVYPLDHNCEICLVISDYSREKSVIVIFFVKLFLSYRIVILAKDV